MDSLTQITLGAAVGEAVLGRKVGNKAMLWGAVAGTIPDLDVLANPFLNEIQKLEYHRGFTHSIVFAMLFAPMLGRLIKKIHPNSAATWKQWSWLAFWGLFTHPLLDALTNWGTQLFLPFSDMRVALNTIFVADPVYTLPFLGFVIAAAVCARTSNRRRLLNWLGIGLSSAYLVFGFFAKYQAKQAFRTAFTQQNIPVSEIFINPTPLNTIFWYSVGKGEHGFWRGTWSLFGDPDKISFDFIPRNHDLLQPIAGTQSLATMEWITKGFHSVSKHQDGLIVHDLRFLITDFGEGDPGSVFNYKFVPAAEAGAEPEVLEAPQPEMDLSSAALDRYWQRIWGANPNATRKLARKYVSAVVRKDGEFTKRLLPSLPSPPMPADATAQEKMNLPVAGPPVEVLRQVYIRNGEAGSAKIIWRGANAGALQADRAPTMQEVIDELDIEGERITAVRRLQPGSR